MTNEAAEFDFTIKNVLICDTQPVAVEGMKWLIRNSGDLRFAGAVTTLDAVYELLNPEGAKAARKLAAEEKAAAELAALELLAMQAEAAIAEPSCTEPSCTEPSYMEPSCMETEMSALIAPVNPELQGTEISVEAAIAAVALEAEPEPVGESIGDSIILPPIIQPIHAVVIDKGLGLVAVMELLQKLTSTSHPTPAVIWGAAISEAEALRLLQAGARGILRRTSESGTLLTCLRAVTAGGTWMEDGIFGSAEKLFNPKRSQLTHREREVVVLVEKGLRNSDIAGMLGIRTGTVKIHLKHIFEKTGVRGRYGLAFTGLQNKGSIALTARPQLA